MQLMTTYSDDVIGDFTFAPTSNWTGDLSTIVIPTKTPFVNDLVIRK